MIFFIHQSWDKRKQTKPSLIELDLQFFSNLWKSFFKWKFKHLVYKRKEWSCPPGQKEGHKSNFHVYFYGKYFSKNSDKMLQIILIFNSRYLCSGYTLYPAYALKVHLNSRKENKAWSRWSNEELYFISRRQMCSELNELVWISV